MTEAELMQEGINLMFSGVGFVVVFLTILIYAIRAMSYIVNRYFPEPAKVAPKAPVMARAVGADDEMERIRPVIVAAIAHHRRQQGIK